MEYKTVYWSSSTILRSWKSLINKINNDQDCSATSILNIIDFFFFFFHKDVFIHFLIKTIIFIYHCSTYFFIVYCIIICYPHEKNNSVWLEVGIVSVVVDTIWFHV